MQDLAHFFYEMGQLKRVKRSGWWVAGIKDPESVAEHTLRTAQLGYVLATLEGADPMKTATMCLFHDTAEARINDFHRLGQRYIEKDSGEHRAFIDQMQRLPTQAAQELTSLVNEYEERTSPEAIIAKDADRLECLMQALEYRSQGYKNVEEWIESNYTALKTPSARRLAEACLQTDPGKWWHLPEE